MTTLLGCLVFLVFISSVTLTDAVPPSLHHLGASQSLRDVRCNDAEEYPSGDVCCIKCQAGFRMVAPCTTGGQRGVCEECEDGTFTEHSSALRHCFWCTKCRSDQEVVKPCTHTQNFECRCRSGGFCAPDQACEVCKTCSRCEKHEETVRNCTSTTNTVCKKIKPHPSSASAVATLTCVSLLGALVLVVISVCIWRCCKRRDSQRNQPLGLKAGEFTTADHLTEDQSGRETRSPSCSSLLRPGQLEDGDFPKLVPVKGDESLKKCFEYFEGVDFDYHKRFFRQLGIADNVIKSKEHLHYEDKIHDLLHIWVEKEGREASLNDLLKALLVLNQRRTAETVKESAVQNGHYLCEH